MPNHIIACTAPIDQIAIHIVKPFEEFVVAADPGVEAFVAVVKDASALIVRGGSMPNARVIQAGPRLKVIARPGIGYESVDIQVATAPGGTENL